MEMIEAKAFRTFIRIYSLFKSEQLRTNINEIITITFVRNYVRVPFIMAHVVFYYMFRSTGISHKKC
jgi:hypothetical protein